MEFIKNNQKILGILLTPSWLSAVICITSGLLASIGIITVLAYTHSSARQEAIAWGPIKIQQPLTTPDQSEPGNDRPTLNNSWPLMVVWGLTGAVAYTITR